MKVRTLTADLNQRDDTIARFQKERKAMEELQQVRHNHTAHCSTVFLQFLVILLTCPDAHSVLRKLWMTFRQRKIK